MTLPAETSDDPNLRLDMELEVGASWPQHTTGDKWGGGKGKDENKD